MVDPVPVSAALAEAAYMFQLPEVNIGNVGVALLTMGIIAACVVVYRDWRKRKGFRMILKDRNDKKHAVLLDILTDGILDRQMKGEISNKEGAELLALCAKKLELYDLVPKKRIASVVKSSLKNDRRKREMMRAKGEYNEHPLAKSTGGPPTPLVRKPFSERVGAAAKFWQK